MQEATQRVVGGRTVEDLVKEPIRPAAWQDPKDPRNVMFHIDRVGRFRDHATHLTLPLFDAEAMARVADEEAAGLEQIGNWRGASAAREIARRIREIGGRNHGR